MARSSNARGILRVGLLATLELEHQPPEERVQLEGIGGQLSRMKP